MPNKPVAERAVTDERRVFEHVEGWEFLADLRAEVVKTPEQRAFERKQAQWAAAASRYVGGKV